MASIHLDPTSGVWRVMFRYGGKQFQKSLKTTDSGEAEALKGRIEITLLDLERGRLSLPPDADFWHFVLSDGKRTQKVEAPTVLTLDQLFTRYEQEMPPGTMEKNSLETCRLHKKHLLRILGSRTNAKAVATTEMQRYVNERSKEKYRGKLISPRTWPQEGHKAAPPFKRRLARPVPFQLFYAGVALAHLEPSASPRDRLTVAKPGQSPVSSSGTSPCERERFWPRRRPSA